MAKSKGGALWLILAIVIAIVGVVFGVIGFWQAKSVEKFVNGKIEAINKKYWEITEDQEKRLIQLDKLSKEQRARVSVMRNQFRGNFLGLRKDIADIVDSLKFFRENLDSLGQGIVSLKEVDSLYQKRFEKQTGMIRSLFQNDRKLLALIQKTAGSNVYFLALPLNERVVKEIKQLLQQPEWQ